MAVRPTEPLDPLDSAQGYARDILSRRLVVSGLTRLAIERDENDHRRIGDPDFPWLFDEAKARRALDFFSLLPHVKGPKANRGEMMRLEAHQSWFYSRLFGWVDSDGLRRFNRVHRELPRGNGKSFEAAVVGLICAFTENEQGAEVYSVATKREQAKIIFETAKRMIQRSDKLREQLGISVNAHNLWQQATGSVFLAQSSEDQTLDGLNIYCALVDELHAHPNRGLYDVIETAISKRDQALLFDITTAGADRTGICYEIRSHLLDVLRGNAEDERFFGVIYTADEGDDWRSEATWAKANPNLDVSVNRATLRSLAQKAESVPAAQASFKTKHLDIWVGADHALFDVERWAKLANPSLLREDFEGEPLYVAFDLATKNDLAARVDLFVRLDEDGRPRFSVFAGHYTNRAAVDLGKNSQMPAWELQGFLRVNDGDATSQAQIEEDLISDAAKFEIREVNIDNFQSAGFAQRLQSRGLTVVEVPQQVRHLSAPTKYLDDLIREGRIEHDGDPVLAWQIGNVVGHFDAKDNVYPRKERRESKIDAAVALIMNLARRMTEVEDSGELSAQIIENGVTFL